MPTGNINRRSKYEKNCFYGSGYSNAAHNRGLPQPKPTPQTLTSATGKPLVIYSWNDEFQGMLKNYYIPAVGGTVEDDGTMILPNGDKIEFVINPNDGGVYQQKLDAALSAGEKLDMFLMEADYALKYVNSDYTLPLSEIGITEDALKDQYPYTVDVARMKTALLKLLFLAGCSRAFPIPVALRKISRRKNA